MNRLAIVVAAFGVGICTAGPALAQAPMTWTGFYIGVHGGTASQSTGPRSFTDSNQFFNAVSINDTTADRAIYGIQGGYNWQFVPAFVVGVEGDFSWTSLSDHRESAPLANIFLGPFPGTATAINMETKWLSSIRGRLGFVPIANALLYVTGGVAWARNSYDAQTVLGGDLFVPQQAGASFASTNQGNVLGAGAEWMATPHILLRAEYLHYKFNGAQGRTEPLLPLNLDFPAPVNYTWSGYGVSVFRVAGSYKF
jgi:opacity protein-like surface antigen